MSAKEHSGDYFIPDPSPWPIIGMFSLLITLFGGALAMNGVSLGSYLVVAGLLMFFYLLYGWFRDVIKENLSDCYNRQVDTSFRMGMFWFIASEVFFFLSFFGALYYIRNIALPWLGGDGYLGVTNEILYHGFENAWPSHGPGELGGDFLPMGAWGIPAINTLILLTSGATITWAHWGLKLDNQKQLVNGLIATIALGVFFVILQAYEYGHAYQELNLTLETGAYGSTFYMLTGFHGFHVTMGAVMLMAILGRSMKSHFSAHNHFAFEAVAWYWHFVDVVWLGLFVFVYWL
ncbi:MAG: cytochrome c oxidase subunit 3 [Candidatus Thiodiazotropha lotti]|uniref:cytochrome-c oxidase n=1 Tax=Candidatus Thiodiazotropha lotti TaxID=2792787 RepID=A0A9E4K1S2_9GAMM|nr:cytochrome c oxidase subunit 3 [Candidatus Thiodiazotropha lotti]ODB94764.1 MFS transporter [Candidatus Thiodiazotropha endoloripes]MCG7922978.1 cytochrome c oxidase subunit 3 [Candidatus Thiodiazotropha lotti]MCG7937747.1 cytochrome c oxidase subunit 3 [Candidatus Thiodiazotropha lotti]MCG7982864.1 cytochrome c oxidase subunit 3 [Candidatus Thiodiazotropha lotti]